MLITETILTKPKIEEKDRTKLPETVLVRVTYPICNIGELNANNRLYERAVWENVLNDSGIQGKLEGRNLYGHAEHPVQTQSDLRETSHLIQGMWIGEDNKVYQTVDVLDTPMGRIVDCLLRADSQVGMSTRAEGDLEEAEDESGNKYQRVVPESYKYVTTDFTADPSTFGVAPMDVRYNVVKTVQKELESKTMKEGDRATARMILESIQKTLEEETVKVTDGTSVDEGHTSIEVTTDAGQSVRVDAEGPTVVNADTDGNVAVNPLPGAMPEPVEPMGMPVEPGMEEPLVEPEPEMPEEEAPLGPPEEEEEEEKMPLESKVKEGRNYFIPSSADAPRGERDEISQAIQQAVNQRLIGKASRDDAGFHLKGVKDPKAVNVLLPTGVTLMRESVESTEGEESVDEEKEPMSKEEGKKYWISKLVQHLETMDKLEPEEEQLLAKAKYELGDLHGMGEENVEEECVEEEGKEENTYESELAEITDLRIKVAEATAERDSALNELKSIRHSKKVARNYVKVREHLLGRINSLKEDINGLRTLIETKATSEKQLKEKMQEADQKLQEATDKLESIAIEHNEDLLDHCSNSRKEGQQEILREYFDRRLQESNLGAHENVRTLVGECDSLHDIDELITGLIKKGRRDALHSQSIKEIAVRRGQPRKSKQAKKQDEVNKLMGDIFEGMGY